MAEERKCLHVCFPSWKFQHDTLRVLTHQISQICAGNDLNSNSKTSSYKRSEFISDRISVLGLKFISLFESNECSFEGTSDESTSEKGEYVYKQCFHK